MKENTPTRTAYPIKATGSKICEMAMACRLYQVAISTMACGSTTSSTVSRNSPIPMAEPELANGIMEIEYDGHLPKHFRSAKVQLVNYQHQSWSLRNVGNMYKTQTIIMEVGSKHLKVGYSGEFQPRTILTLSKLTNWKCIFFKLFRTHLSINAKDRNVIVLEHLYYSQMERKKIADSLLLYYKVASLAFYPAIAMVPFGIGSKTMLVVDLGQTETRVVPVFEKSFMRSLYASM